MREALADQFSLGGEKEMNLGLGGKLALINRGRKGIGKAVARSLMTDHVNAKYLCWES